ncbi:uncharacterized protein BO97DRAFT_407439 [Aspergillus homomorphus CBS 101889]|uniref:Uncharacterized protein n=1 Tax=Aspergillus homomorphus (strain CBS 101889) TaxID=1450537 RepID=A0A395HQY7_ASPHC|nr:hypothetical protein BO97DRAFT_407439 [Aspergillus homomorphus CBS 101889]RAL09899.1 hypothetical protein BO97DRAFT_407439 [Aspergillus homomorphus CBS 101889]
MELLLWLTHGSASVCLSVRPPGRPAVLGRNSSSAVGALLCDLLWIESGFLSHCGISEHVDPLPSKIAYKKRKRLNRFLFASDRNPPNQKVSPGDVGKN